VAVTVSGRPGHRTRRRVTGRTIVRRPRLVVFGYDRSWRNRDRDCLESPRPLGSVDSLWSSDSVLRSLLRPPSPRGRPLSVPPALGSSGGRRLSEHRPATGAVRKSASPGSHPATSPHSRLARALP
jgi:hypothetical protein